MKQKRFLAMPIVFDCSSEVFEYERLYSTKGSGWCVLFEQRILFGERRN